MAGLYLVTHPYQHTEKQALVLTDHDSRVLARRRLRAKACELGSVLQWARQQAREHGFDDVTVGCEPTGHRWRVLDQLAAQRDMALVCVQPLLVGLARESEDYTRDKSDDKDAVLIARLVGQLSCYVPERADETWARLRHLGARRERLITEATGCVQQLWDLRECAWPAVLSAAVRQFDCTTWCAALAVVFARCVVIPAGSVKRQNRGDGAPPGPLSAPARQLAAHHGQHLGAQRFQCVSSVRSSHFWYAVMVSSRVITSAAVCPLASICSAKRLPLRITDASCLE